jgi:hypothetical protein
MGVCTTMIFTGLKNENNCHKKLNFEGKILSSKDTCFCGNPLTLIPVKVYTKSNRQNNLLSIFSRLLKTPL